MSTASSHQIRYLPLHQRHVERGAKLGQFGDWEVPLYYTSILEEHDAVRNRAGLFDISHMGEFFIRGSAALAFLEQVLPRPISSMTLGKALYMPLLNNHGGFIDDIILYRLEPDFFLMIVNAGNVDKDFEWLQSCKKRLDPQNTFELTNQTDEKGLLALQGPKSEAIVRAAFGAEFASLGYYYAKPWKKGLIARTGYTGEDGFEIMVDQKHLNELWNLLFKFGTAEGLVPAGFGARDTLRLEAAMPLYGHDMDDQITPLEAGIGWAVDLNKPGFIGREPLVKQKAEGVQKKLVGFEMIDRGIPRQGFEIKKGEKSLGVVTSGSFSPTLQKNIGLGYVVASEAAAGNEIEILIRDKAVKARIIKLPFYKRKK